MYEKNGIIYSGNKAITIEVVDVKILEDMIMLITFNDGKVKLYDCSQLLHQSAFAKLSDINIFKAPIVVDGVVTWDNESIDIAPETMYHNGFEYNQNNIIVCR